MSTVPPHPLYQSESDWLSDTHGSFRRRIQRRLANWRWKSFWSHNPKGGNRGLAFRYVWWRDNKICGQCGIRPKRRKAEARAIVPGDMAIIHVNYDGRVDDRRGSWVAKVPHVDNAQIVCTRHDRRWRKHVNDWRHDSIERQVVAWHRTTGELLWVPFPQDADDQ